jgi:alkanesulfonate monooxygenase SsuD/methylene tetrahydromethanopterin reductase-like flavin-dependent oxidoreductase (luciferase family)
LDFGVHLPLMDFGGQGLSRGRLEASVDAARECRFAAVSANDHFVFSTPWLDGPTALAAVVERSRDMVLATTLSLAVLRGPVPLAKTLSALDILSEGRLIAGLGPGSSKLDYGALGVPFEERWKRLDEAIAMLRALLRGDVGTDGGRRKTVSKNSSMRCRAEGVGFEPTKDQTALNGFRDRPVQPLRHPSGEVGKRLAGAERVGFEPTRR